MKNRLFAKNVLYLHDENHLKISETTITMHKIELLAPARTADVGIEAFKHGADAVYIGAPAFSARAAAGNTVADIERLAAFGHQYGAKTIIALNTILTDAELVEAERLAWQLYETGVDALIIQDLGLLQMNLPPIELHASTQTDNRTPEKVRLLHDLGMTRVVMARELSISQIAEIHDAVPDVELECFIHGALCVSLSGQCYMSAALTGRSANRGQCAQPCRLPMDLLDAQGTKLLARQQHLLSLRDMNRSAYIEQLIEAGVTSLKIEGRLKEVNYVKNVVAYYRQLIDRLIEKHDDYQSLSDGKCSYSFEPCLAKSFNRGFTSYFADGKREPMWNFDSPKSQGERVGTITRVDRGRFDYEGQMLHNGDGLVVGQLGFRLNRFELHPNKTGATDIVKGTCYPLDGETVCRQLKRGQTLWRNLDFAFEQQLAKETARRVLPVDMHFTASSEGITLAIESRPEDRVEVTISEHFDKAERPQRDNIGKQLGKLGGTILELRNLVIKGDDIFVPSSKIAVLRREAVECWLTNRLKMQTELRKGFCAPDYAKLLPGVDARGILPSSFLANVYNKKALQSYQEMGIENIEHAFERQQPNEGIVMQTKHCLKYAFGQCPRYPNPNPMKMLDPEYRIGQELQLRIGHQKFILKFGCKNDCISKIFTIFAPQ